MHRVEWDDALITGDARVDEQHRRICELTREFAEVVEDGGDPDRTADALYLLLRYCASHVADEEALMRRVEYPDYERQRALHAGFLRESRSLAEDFLHDRGVTAQVLLGHLTDLWHDHICVVDRDLAEFIRERETA